MSTGPARLTPLGASDKKPARQGKAKLAQPTQRDGRSPALVAFRSAGRRATGNQCLQPPLLLDMLPGSGPGR